MTRKVIAAAVVLALVPSALLALFMWLLFASRPAPLSNACPGTSGNVVEAVDGPTPGLTPEQGENARTIIREGLAMQIPVQGLVVAITAASQESGLRNLHYGDRDSQGLFQMRPSQGWGTVAQVTDPVYASRKFYSVLQAVPGWQSLPVDVAAQRVERSGNPGAYAKWIDRAWKIVRAATDTTPTVVPAAATGISVGFTLASFNVLGKSHTGGASANRRMHNAVKVLAKHSVDVVGFQEMQGGQLALFDQLTAGAWRTYHSPGDTDNTIAWNPARFDGPLSGSRFLSVPYFDGHHRQMPAVRLRDRQTGQTLTLLNVHNPADTRQYHHQAQWRRAALDVELPFLDKVAASGQPVFWTGDMNDHDAFYRPVRASSKMTGQSADTYGGIDWILSSPGQTLTYTTDDSPLVDASTDHPILVARVTPSSAPELGVPVDNGNSSPAPDEPVLVDGKKVSAITARQLRLAEQLGHIDLHVMQGGYGGDGVEASGSSHNYPGVADISPGTIEVEKLLRQVGFAAWARNIPGRVHVGSGEHVHAVSLLEPGDRTSRQVTGSWPAHKDGDGGGPGSDPAPHYPWIPNLVDQVNGTDITGPDTAPAAATGAGCGAQDAPPPADPGGTTGPAPMSLPAPVVGVYYMAFTDNPKGLLESVPAGVNVVYLSFLQGDPPHLTEDPSPALVRDVKALRARGVRVLGSVGGERGPVNIHNPAAFVAGVEAVSRQVPLDGIDWDIESGDWNTADVVAISTALKQKGMIITMAPNGSGIGDYIETAKVLQARGALDMIGMQMYGGPVTLEQALWRTGQIVDAGIPQSKVSIGFMLPAGGMEGKTWDLPTSQRVMAAAKAKWPGLRGGYLWQAGNAGTAEWVSTMRQILRA